MDEDLDLKELNQEKKYTEICTFWDNRKNMDPVPELSEWDYVYCMNALYKEKRYNDCLQLYKEFHTTYKESALLNSKMGWSLYHVHLKNHDFKKGNNGQYIKQVNFILAHCEQEAYSPLTKVIFDAVKAILSGALGNPPNYVLANQYLDCLDPQKLSFSERTYQTPQGRTVKGASDREKWFNDKTKVLYSLKEYQKCIDYCDQALLHVFLRRNFHNNSDIWLQQKKISSLIALDDLATAKTGITKLLRKPHLHWSIYELAFTIAEKEKNVEEALQYAGRCALADSSHDMRVTFYANLAIFLHQQGWEEMASLHRQLVDAIRREKGWKKYKWPADWQVEETSLKSTEIIKKLKPFWQEQSDKAKVFLIGTVKVLLGNGQSGFIKAIDGKDYYFNLRDTGKYSSQIQEGVRVKFTVEEHFDKKKNKMSLAAVDIRISEE